MNEEPDNGDVMQRIFPHRVIPNAGHVAAWDELFFFRRNLFEG